MNGKISTLMYEICVFLFIIITKNAHIDSQLESDLCANVNEHRALVEIE